MTEAPTKRKSSAKHAEDAASTSTPKAPKKRTKSGCLTCRKRRIKCDEGKPECKNCVKAKKTCEQAPVPQNLKRPVKNELGPSQELLGKSYDSKLSIDGDESFESLKVNLKLRHYPQSYTSSHGSRHSPKEAQDPSYSPQTTLPIESGSLSNLFGTYASTSVPPEEVVDYQSFYAGAMQPATSTPSLAFEHLALTSPMYQQQEGTQFPFFGSPVPDSLSTSDGHSSHNSRIDYALTAAPGPSTVIPSFRARMPSDPAVISRQDFAAKMGLDFRIGRRNYGQALSPRQRNYLRHFMLNVNMNFTTTTEIPTAQGKVMISTSNFFTKIIPSMALQSLALLHAVLAISALHESNTKRKPVHEALMDYQDSIKHLAQTLIDPDPFDRDSQLATCLILAYFETMSGHVVKWGRHLQGSCDFVRTRIMASYTANQPEHYQFVADPAVADHLIWFHIHQDTIQAILSGNGLFLDLKYIQMCPVRGDPGSVMHVSDQLRVLLARLGDFVFKDRQRKEGAKGDPQELSTAIAQWDDLLAAIDAWRINLNPYFVSMAVPNTVTPFGSVLVSAHPAIASFQILSLAALLYLHRAHPTFSHIPAESMRAAAPTTHVIVQDVVRTLSGIMSESISNKTIETGAHLKAMINAVLPALLAGIALREPAQRAFLEHLVQDIYTYTGWRTAIRVLQGLDVAWGREPRPAEGLEMLTGQNPDYEHDMGGDAMKTKPYANLDKAETMSVASGILGRLKVKDTVPRSQEQYWLTGGATDHVISRAAGGGGGGTDEGSFSIGAGNLDGELPFVDWHVPFEVPDYAWTA